MRHLKTLPRKLGDETEGLLITGTEHGGRSVFHGPPDFRGELASFEVKVAGENEILSYRQAAGFKSGAVAVRPSRCQDIAAWAGDVADLPMAQIDEVSDGLFSAPGIVDRNRWGRAVRRIFTS